MTHRTYELDGFALPLPITETARATAQQFAREQPTPAKAAQVQLNTLAVQVVNDYLDLMGIATNLAGSDSWNPVMRICSDVADLELPGVGRLECRPVGEQIQTCPVPPEVWEERVGYVVVQIADSFQEAKILGFAQAAAEALPLNQLRSPEELLDHLHGLNPTTAPQAQTSPVQTTPRINLSQWIDGIVEAGWQTVDWLLNQPELAPAYAFRGSDTAIFQDLETGIRRLKLLHLGGQPGAVSVILIVDVQPQSQPESTTGAAAATINTAEIAPTNIRLQVHPISQPQLPRGVQLVVLDDTGTTFLDAQSRDQDSYIQLQFSGTPGEAFSAQVTFGNIQVTEAFMI